MMELSLIICTYRRPKEVRRLLESIAEQTRIPDEILIVDGSDDVETKQTIENLEGRLKDLPISYFLVDTQDRGLTRQRNFGIARANGKRIAFLDDDVVLEPEYFSEIEACFERNKDAMGVGGYIKSSVEWRKVSPEEKTGLLEYRFGDWVRRDDIRWVIRKILGLDSPLPPGWIPASGNGRSLGALPPDGNDHQVQILMGGASAWRREIFEEQQFSTYFEGYGLYEDFDFSIRASKSHRLVLCTNAQLDHYHAPSGRPDYFKYGKMVVRNGWYVWRVQYPSPAFTSRMKWWATGVLLMLLRLVDLRAGNAMGSVVEGLGRMWGMTTLLWKSPK
jgi:glycosyltransferase involved in cell wall biosynthesis